VGLGREPSVTRGVVTPPVFPPRVVGGPTRKSYRVLVSVHRVPAANRKERPDGSLRHVSRPGRPSTGRGCSAPAMARERAEPPIIGVGGVLDHGHGQYHLMPAPRDRAMVARSDRAKVKRARFAFTEPPRTVVIQFDRVWQLGG